MGTGLLWIGILLYYLHLNITKLKSWLVNVASANGLMPSGNSAKVWVDIDLGDVLLPVWWQAITWANADLSLAGSLETNQDKMFLWLSLIPYHLYPTKVWGY